MKGSNEFLVLTFVVVTLSIISKAWSQPLVPGFFIFGDSLVDNGNNNRILTLARANYRPYGIDFPQGATGRFTNGRTYVDALAQLFGFPSYVPPYARTRGPALLRGANYASGASGIRDETGNNLGDHTSMKGQVNNFASTVEDMKRFFRRDPEALTTHLSKCIFYFGMGSNDYLNNYFMTDFYSTGSQFTPEAYAATLLQDYTRYLTQMHSLGARKMIISGVGQIGCIPYHLARYSGNSSSRCNEKINSAIDIFNTGLRKMVDDFNGGRLAGAKVVYLDSYASTTQLHLSSSTNTNGFGVIDKGCCGVGRNNGQLTCLPLQEACRDRSNYLFWDAFHPTEAANILFAKASFAANDSSQSFTYPINIQQLALL